MYGWAYPYVVYGFTERRHDRYISEDWLADHNLEAFGWDISRCTSTHATYGMSVAIDRKTGKAQAGEKLMKRVLHVATIMKREHTVGYYLVVRGEAEFEGYEYVPKGFKNDDFDYEDLDSVSEERRNEAENKHDDDEEVDDEEDELEDE